MIKEIFGNTKLDDICNFLRRFYFSDATTFLFKKINDDVEAIAGNFNISIVQQEQESSNYQFKEFNQYNSINFKEQIKQLNQTLDELNHDYQITKKQLTTKLDILQYQYKQQSMKQNILASLKQITLSQKSHKHINQGKQIIESHGLFKVNQSKFGVSTQSNLLQLYNTNTLSLVNSIALTGQVYASCSINQQLILSGGKNKKNQMFLIHLNNSYKRINTINFSSQILVSKCKNEYIITAASDLHIRLFDIVKYDEVTQLQGSTEQISDVIDLDQYIVCGCGWDSNVRIWDVRNEKQIKQLSRFNWLKCVKGYQDQIIFGGNDGFVGRWDWKKSNGGSQIQQLCVGFQISSLDLIYKEVVYGGQSANVCLCNMSTMIGGSQCQTQNQQAIKSILNCNDDLVVSGDASMNLDVFTISKTFQKIL